MSFAAARFDSAADTYDDDPHHLLIAQQLVAGLRPAPSPELVVDVATGTGSADQAGAERIARAAGFESVRVTTTPPPRRAFLVWADAPARTPGRRAAPTDQRASHRVGRTRPHGL